MGLLDVLNGMQNGPRGQTDPNAKGGMSPVTMAILALLAYKGLKHMSGGQAPAPGTTPGRAPAGGATADGGGGLGGLLGGLLGGGGAGGGAGGGLPGGLGDLLKGLGGGAGGAGGGLPGGLGDLLKGLGGGGAGGGLAGGLGGLLAGGAGGSILSGGLDSLVKQLQQNGQGAAAKSWVGNGPNQDISPGDLAKAIGADDIDAIVQHTGLTRDQLLEGLRKELPGAVDELTPDGRVPSADELSQRI